MCSHRSNVPSCPSIDQPIAEWPLCLSATHLWMPAHFPQFLKHSSNCPIFLLLKIIFCFFPAVYLLSLPFKSGLSMNFFFLLLSKPLPIRHINNLPKAMATSQALSWLLCRSLYNRLSHPILKVSSPSFWNTLLALFLAIFPHFLWLAHHLLIDNFGLVSGPQSLPISFSLLYWKASLCITLQTFPRTPCSYVQPSTKQAFPVVWQIPQLQAWKWAAVLLWSHCPTPADESQNLGHPSPSRCFLPAALTSANYAGCTFVLNQVTDWLFGSPNSCWLRTGSSLFWIFWIIFCLGLHIFLLHGLFSKITGLVISKVAVMHNFFFFF